MKITNIKEEPETNTVLLELEMTQEEHIALLTAAVTRGMVLAIEEQKETEKRYENV